MLYLATHIPSNCVWSETTTKERKWETSVNGIVFNAPCEVTLWAASYYLGKCIVRKHIPVSLS